jgi:hypothetical protein
VNSKEADSFRWPVLVFTCLLVLILILMTGCAERQERRIRELRERVAELTSETVAMKLRVDSYLEDQITVDLRFMNRTGDVVGEANNIVLNGHELIVEYLMIPIEENRRGSRSQYLALPYRLYTEVLAPVEGYRVLPYYFEPSEDLAPRIFEGGDEPMERNHLREVRDLLDPFLDDAEVATGIIFVNERRPTGARRLREGQVYRVVSRVTGTIEMFEEM